MAYLHMRDSGETSHIFYHPVDISLTVYCSLSYSHIRGRSSLLMQTKHFLLLLVKRVQLAKTQDDDNVRKRNALVTAVCADCDC